ncbi:MAG: cobalamin B12-binding domain-containing protein [Bradymonadaceae bacterium]|nr:cobalamin B12-binding domain-containing protein [Lujinxingiaceae bacterium]
MTLIGRTGATPPDLSRVRPYGDTIDDGQIQLAFTLPVPFGEEAREAARQVLRQMGLGDPRIYHMHDLGEGYTYFIAYGRFEATIDFTSIHVAKVESSRMDFYAVNAFVREHIGRKVTILGACTGTDAHSVGIDAIMNMKGYAGEYGLERYPMFNAFNLGMQVQNEDLIAQAIEKKADALLVSQIVTQKDVHIRNLAELIDMLEAEGMRERLIVVCGGPRITHELALELGFDAGFSAGATAPDVASFVVHEMLKRKLA